MANQNQQTLGQRVAQSGLLDQLLQQGAQGLQAGIEAGGQALQSPLGQQFLARLLKSAPGVTQLAQLGQQQQPQLTSMERDVFEKEINKNLKEKAAEFIQMKGTDAAQQLLQQNQSQVLSPQTSAGNNDINKALGQKPSQPNSTPTTPTPTTPATQTTSEQQRNFLEQILSLGGLLKDRTEAGMLRAAQRKEIEQRTALGGQEQINLFKEKFKQDRLDQREILKAQLKSGGANDPMIAAQTFTSDMTNFIQAFDNLPVKGRGRGTLSAALGFTGVGRKERATFESMRDLMPFFVGQFIAGQTARALSDKDIERVEKLSKFTTGMGEAAFRGKLKAIFAFTNSKLRAAGANPLPDVNTFLKQLRGNKQQTNNRQVQTTQDTQAEIDAINAKLDKLGGR